MLNKSIRKFVLKLGKRLRANVDSQTEFDLENEINIIVTNEINKIKDGFSCQCKVPKFQHFSFGYICLKCGNKPIKKEN